TIKDFFSSNILHSNSIFSSTSDALAFHRQTINKEHLLKSLTPLYIGRTASFVKETWDSGASEVEEKIEGLCLMFEEKKSIIVEKWDT
ncbi:MAG: hypothetical protein ACM3MB_03530, partial [Acidobacteriota bacterium]